MESVEPRAVLQPNDENKDRRPTATCRGGPRPTVMIAGMVLQTIMILDSGGEVK